MCNEERKRDIKSNQKLKYIIDHLEENHKKFREIIKETALRVEKVPIMENPKIVPFILWLIIALLCYDIWLGGRDIIFLVLGICSWFLSVILLFQIFKERKR